MMCCAVAEQLEAQLGADHFLSYRLWDQITQLHQEQVPRCDLIVRHSAFVGHCNLPGRLSASLGVHCMCNSLVHCTEVRGLYATDRTNREQMIAAFCRGNMRIR
jgi:hypothetical protein